MKVKTAKNVLGAINAIGIFAGLASLITAFNTGMSFLYILCITIFILSFAAGIITGYLKRKYFPQEVKNDKMLDDSREMNWEDWTMS